MIPKFQKVLNDLKDRENRPKVDAETINDEIRISTAKLLEAGLTARNPVIFDAMVLYLAETKLECRRKGLLICGGVGTGKTTALEMIAAIRRLHIYYADELLRDFVDSSTAFWEKMDVREDIVIDDLGDEVTLNHYGNKSEKMAEVIISRYRIFQSCGARTLITTNLTVKEINERYGRRVYSRLIEMCQLAGVSNGVDLRRDK